MKPNCYECKYRDDVAGSAHSCCTHPSFTKVMNDPFAQVMGIFASIGRVAPIQAESKKTIVRGDPRGIKKGWFNHPFNFDPTWLIECNGFEMDRNEQK